MAANAAFVIFGALSSVWEFGFVGRICCACWSARCGGEADPVHCEIKLGVRAYEIWRVEDAWIGAVLIEARLCCDKGGQFPEVIIDSPFDPVGEAVWDWDTERVSDSGQ